MFLIFDDRDFATPMPGTSRSDYYYNHRHQNAGSATLKRSDLVTDVLLLGATINRVDEEQFTVFAPNSQVLQEIMEKISELTAEPEVTDFSVVKTFLLSFVTFPGSRHQRI